MTHLSAISWSLVVRARTSASTTSCRGSVLPHRRSLQRPRRAGHPRDGREPSRRVPRTDRRTAPTRPRQHRDRRLPPSVACRAGQPGDLRGRGARPRPARVPTRTPSWPLEGRRRRGTTGPARAGRGRGRTSSVRRPGPAGVRARMQPASDIFLGWASTPNGRDFYVRQLHDMKVSVALAGDVGHLTRYAEFCGPALARAHASTVRLHRSPATWARPIGRSRSRGDLRRSDRTRSPSARRGDRQRSSPGHHGNHVGTATVSAPCGRSPHGCCVHRCGRRSRVGSALTKSTTAGRAHTLGNRPWSTGARRVPQVHPPAPRVER